MELHTYLEGMDQLSAPRKSIPVTKCDICDVDLAVSSLQRHKKIVHKLNIGKQIQCPECEKLFQSKDRLIMHLAKSHGLSTPDYTLYSIQCFPVQNATTSQIQRRTWAFTKRGCTQQDQAYGCAWPERVKRSPDLFWTNTNTKNTNKTMPMWIAQCAINHLVQSEIWRGTWKPFIKQWRWMCLETQIIPIQTTISMSRMKSSTMLPFWWTLCFDSHSTCQHSWTICTKLVQW